MPATCPTGSTVRALVAVTAAALAGMVWGAAPARAARPNVVVVLADDLGWGDLERHGGPVRTPALDRLAREGVELRRFYAHPVCSPTRAALLTGCLPRRYGIDRPLGPRDAGLPAGLPTLPRTLAAAGYRTHLVGKWHLGSASPPLATGFDHFFGFLGAEIDSFTHRNRRGDIDWQRDGETVDEEGYAALLMADEAVRIIGQEDDRPFYLQVALNVPHFPILAPADAVAKYAHLPERQATRCGMIDVLDTALGRILTALDARRLAADTLVLFLSDNGADGSGSNLPFRARKGTVYEGGIRVPAIARWPGRLRPGSTAEQPIAMQDLFPTLCAAVGVPLPRDVRCDGIDLWPALAAGRVAERPPLVIALADRTCIDGDWKLIVAAGTAAGRDGAVELYDLGADPGETRNLSDSHPDTAARLRDHLAQVEAAFVAASSGPPGQPGRGRPPPGRGRPPPRAGR